MELLYLLGSTVVLLIDLLPHNSLILILCDPAHFLLSALVSADIPKDIQVRKLIVTYLKCAGKW